MQKISFITLLVFSLHCNSQNVGIGTNTPESSAMLDVASSSKGFLPPRMTISQRNSIANPSAGLIIWNTECIELEVYNGVTWTTINGSTPCVINPPIESATICNQVWMAKNLNVDHYQNGDKIPQVTDQNQWSNLTTGAWCWYNNDSITYAATYGRLYNWYAVNDPRGLAPLGWHIPTYAEWSKLIDTCLGGVLLAGGTMKETGTLHWISPNVGATNTSGFTGLPGGDHEPLGGFYGIEEGGTWWSSTELNNNVTRAWFINLVYSNSYANKNDALKSSGFSVRCIKNY